MIPRVHFSAPGFPPVPIPDGHGLAEHLTVRNSPVLFGCRTGLCGTCLARVTGDVDPPDLDERDVLGLLAPGTADARLLCQVHLRGDLRVIEVLG